MGAMTFEHLRGKILRMVAVNDDNTEISFIDEEGSLYKLRHHQDCCESVYIESIVGDLDDLLDTPILRAEEAESHDAPAAEGGGTEESYTWTFYKLATIKGYVDIRFYGSSNGYYSESVSFDLIK